MSARRRGLDQEGAASTLADLVDRRDGLTRWEQNLLDAKLAFREGDRPRQYAALSRLVAMTPDSEWNFELARVAADLGRYQEAITLLESVRDQGWVAEFDWYWWILTQARHLAGQYERELQDVRAARARFPDAPIALEAMPLAALGRVEEALGLAQKPGVFVTIVSELSNHGHHELAQRVIRDHLPSVDLIHPNREVADPNTNPWTIFEAENADLLFLTGRLAES